MKRRPERLSEFQFFFQLPPTGNFDYTHIEPDIPHITLSRAETIDPAPESKPS